MLILHDSISDGRVFKHDKAESTRLPRLAAVTDERLLDDSIILHTALPNTCTVLRAHTRVHVWSRCAGVARQRADLEQLREHRQPLQYITERHSQAMAHYHAQTYKVR